MLYIISLLITILEWVLRALLLFLALAAIWNGIRIEIGKPGDTCHITFEMYSAKRLFK